MLRAAGLSRSTAPQCTHGTWRSGTPRVYTLKANLRRPRVGSGDQSAPATSFIHEGVFKGWFSQSAGVGVVSAFQSTRTGDFAATILISGIGALGMPGVTD